MSGKVFTCMICKKPYVFEDHHSCLDTRAVDLTARAKLSGYRPSRREYYKEYMRKRRAEQRDNETPNH